MSEARILSQQLLMAAKAFDEFAHTHGADNAIVSVAITKDGLELSATCKPANPSFLKMVVPFIKMVSEIRARASNE